MRQRGRTWVRQAYPIDRVSELRPSLIVNLYATSFSFEPHAGAHPYTASMRAMLAYFDKQVGVARMRTRVPAPT